MTIINRRPYTDDMPRDDLRAQALTPAQRAYLTFLVTGVKIEGGCWQGNPSVRNALRRRGYIRLEWVTGPSSAWRAWRATDDGAAALARANETEKTG